jgi:hypothetical protein
VALELGAGRRRRVARMGTGRGSRAGRRLRVARIDAGRGPGTGRCWPTQEWPQIGAPPAPSDAVAEWLTAGPHGRRRGIGHIQIYRFDFHCLL